MYPLCRDVVWWCGVWVCGRVFCVCLLVNVNVHSLFLSQTSWSIYPKLYNNIPFSQTMVLSQTGIMNNQVVNGQTEDKAEGQGRITQNGQRVQSFPVSDPLQASASPSRPPCTWWGMTDNERYSSGQGNVNSNFVGLVLNSDPNPPPQNLVDNFLI